VVTAAALSADQVDDRNVADTEDKEPSDGQPESQDVKQLQELYDLMQAEGLEHLELEDATTKIRLQRGRRHAAHDTSHRSSGSSHFAPAPAQSPAASSGAEASDGQTIQTPLAGVFYRASSPSSAPYVQEGSVVEPGQTLCIVEAMKVMNEIKAESRCRIVKILAENSRPVAAEQALFRVEPA
jgi:acetyl-CoA carboxylase biotin carboxyl carrier protein